MTNSVKYVALDVFHHAGLGTVGPKSEPFTLADHDAKFLLLNGRVKIAKASASKAAPEQSGDKAAPAAKAIKAAPENKKRDTKASNK